MNILNNSFFAGIRSGKNAFWRYLLTLLLVGITAVVTAGVVGVVALLIEGTSDPFALSDGTFLLVAMLPFVFMLVVLWLCLRILHERPLVSLISPVEPPRWRWAALSAAVWFGLAALTDVVMYFINPGNYSFSFEPARLLPFLAVSLLLVPVQTSVEELLFRGYLTQWAGLLFRSMWAALLLPNVLFGLLHGANPEVGAYGFGWMMANYIGMGLLLGWITLRSQGLELALGLHAANNLYSLLVTFPGSALKTPALVMLRSYDARLGLLILVLSAVAYLLIMRGVLNQRRKSADNGTAVDVKHA